jgi:SAM-dependent methyltransferase
MPDGGERQGSRMVRDSAAQSCVFCGWRGEPAETALVPANVRSLRGLVFPVWRCPACRCIHSAASVDYAEIYRDYPVFRQQLDFAARLLFESRLKMLLRHGLRNSHSVLDYGGGAGLFCRFLHERGLAGAETWDPYGSTGSPRQSDYDWVLNQDVIEHVDDVPAFLAEVTRLVRPGGFLVTGTPNAEAIRLDDPIDHAGHLHQPYHRHLMTPEVLEGLIAPLGLHRVGLARKWYLDTYWPGINAQFFFRYCALSDGTIDAIFDPISPKTVLAHPTLAFWLLLGGAFERKNQHFTSFHRRK